jgi:outer membrane protein with beta-barrel domain
MIRLIPCALLVLEAAVGQSLRPALQVGIPFTPYFDTGTSGGLHGSDEYSAATRRYTIGVSVEWRMAEHFGFAAGVLYHRMGYVALVNVFNSATGDFRNTALDVKGNSWDFPLMARYHLPGPARPFLAAGGVLRYVGPVHGRGTETTGSLVTRSSSTVVLDTSDPSDLRKRFYPGVTAAAGMELRAGRVRMLPELRYTWWTANISGEGGLLRFAPNQVEFLVGLTF